jgi:hypothetical protein
MDTVLFDDFVGEMKRLEKEGVRFTERTGNLYFRTFLGKYKSMWKKKKEFDDIDVQVENIKYMLHVIAKNPDSCSSGQLIKVFTLKVLYDFLQYIACLPPSSSFVINGLLNESSSVVQQLQEVIVSKGKGLLLDMPLSIRGAHDRTSTIFPVRWFYLQLAREMQESVRRCLLVCGLMWDHKYVMEVAKTMVDTYREELMKQTWHPKRLSWCLDYEEYREIFASA